MTSNANPVGAHFAIRCFSNMQIITLRNSYISVLRPFDALPITPYGRVNITEPTNRSWYYFFLFPFL